jgi:DNA polymerase-3 subunit delta'
MLQFSGAEPRFFPKTSLQGIKTDIKLLAQWSKQLAGAMETMEHPFNAGLMAEALVSQAQSVLNSGDPRKK